MIAKSVAWPDTLLMEEQPVHDHDSANATTRTTTTTTTSANSLDWKKKHNSVTFSIASFNILAEAYLTPRSHKNLPPSSANIVFDKKLRRKLLCDTLEKLTEVFDILCLQELDDALQDVVFERLGNLGYSFVYAPRGGVPIKSPNVVNVDIGVETFMGGGNEKEQDVRSDGCATFFCKKRWKCVKYNIVNFDDLAEENRPLLEKDKKEEDSTQSYRENNANDLFTKKKKKSHCPISGIIASYRRRNTALVVELQHNMSSRANHIVVANAHLYWHPGYEYVKLSQAHYLVHKVKEFVNESVTKGSSDESRRPIVLICGDMNSKPNSVVYDYFTKGMVDARLVAPWNFSYDEIQEQQELALQMEQLSMNNYTSQDTIHGCNEDLDQDPVVGVDSGSSDNGGFDNDKDDGNTCVIYKDETLLSLANQSSSTYSQVNDPLLIDRSTVAIQPTRYLLDVTLNKFSRWLRILGQDAVLETTEEEKLRTGEGKMLLFERCRKEKRNLITTSKTLLVRKDCPPGTYLVNPSTTTSLEDALVHLLLLHGVTLYPDNFLTRCVVCNGSIVEVFDRAEQKAIFVEYGSPDLTEELDHVYKCSSCGQGYWWSSSPNSSASRVKDACTHLLKLCLRGGVQVEGQPEFFSHVNYEEERNHGRIERMKYLSRTKYHPGAIEEVLRWLKTDKLRNPFDLKSSYATEKDGEVDGELLPFTNVTSDFVGALDYIFFEKEKLRQVGRFAVPKSFAKLNSESEVNGHLLPSKYWPSDHLCIGAKFSFAYSFDENDSSQITSAFVPSGIPAHLSPQLGCNCGCVPKVLSLFQMAELRKQAKLKKASETLS